MAIDMFSLGCILAELYTGYPLFPGENEVEQLACIMEIMGLPSQSILDKAKRKKVFFGRQTFYFIIFYQTCFAFEIVCMIGSHYA